MGLYLKGTSALCQELRAVQKDAYLERQGQVICPKCGKWVRGPNFCNLCGALLKPVSAQPEPLVKPNVKWLSRKQRVKELSEIKKINFLERALEESILANKHLVNVPVVERPKYLHNVWGLNRGDFGIVLTIHKAGAPYSTVEFVAKLVREVSQHEAFVRVRRLAKRQKFLAKVKSRAWRNYGYEAPYKFKEVNE